MGYPPDPIGGGEEGCTSCSLRVSLTMSAPPPPPPLLGKKLPPVSKNKKAPAGGASLQQAISGSSSGTLPTVRAANFFQEKSAYGTGLSNQGATCYMNSLLQTLYLTPECRQLIYAWRRPSESAGTFSIPFQLQRLFARMQFGLVPSVETKDLTRSFGWEEGDSFDQHDVQELMKVLFDALDSTFANTKGKDGDKQQGQDTMSINNLFQGHLEDYITCQTCGQGSRRVDAFTDVPLVVRGMSSVQDALVMFNTPEILDGDNKYSCSTCGSKQDAQKGLRLVDLPPLLTLQLKRFDYDPATWRRVKLNTRMTFPMELGMAPYLATHTEGAHMYDLLSVLIHSGGAMGGHYFAYVHDVLNNQWVKVNDSQVTAITPKDIEAMYGEEEAPGKSAPLSSTNAYMLVYRRRDPSTTTEPKPTTATFQIGSEDIPHDVRDEVTKENEDFMKERDEYIKRRDNLSLKVLYGSDSTVININKFQTLSDAVDNAYASLSSSGGDQPFPHARENVRLRGWNSFTQSPGDIYAEEDAKKTLDALHFHSNKQLILETREPGGEFPRPSTKIIIRAVGLDQSNEFLAPVDIVIEKTAPLSQLRTKASESMRLSGPDTCRLFRLILKGGDGAREAEEMDATKNDTSLEQLNIAEGTVIYAEEGAICSAESGIQQRFDSERFMIEIGYNRLDEKTYDNFISVDRRKPLRTLKARIAPVLECPVDTFKLCKNALSKEFKDEDMTIQEAGLFDGCTVHIAKGSPMQKGQLKASFLIHVPTVEPSLPTQGEVTTIPPPTLKPLQSLIISESQTGAELRALLLPYVKESGSSVSDPACLRVREKLGSRMGKILRTNKSLKQNLPNVKDGSELIIQVLDAPEDLQNDDMLLEVVRFRPSALRVADMLSEKAELVVPNASTAPISGLLPLLSQVSRNPQIGPSLVQVTKPMRFMLADPFCLFSLNWEVDTDRTITQSPWYMTDGDIIAYKDGAEPDWPAIVDEESDEAKEALEKRKQATTAAIATRPKEKGVKIYTQYDEGYEFMSEN
eukprot:TRINITY_DN4306_c0_g1_i6.p1 TRINITY_DN4306_c0_g1~~TRINITY_DN4306_c0_g1_i6.p1  ORF type:complete len:1027 (-),score=234.69 TRINITY_DN4306_c0_g1_i6:35-3115(-)